LILNQQSADTEVSTYKVVEPPDTVRGVRVRQLLENYQFLRVGLLIIVLLGTCMVIGDGVLTPSISVLSAISGISVAAPQLHQNIVVLVSCFILVLLFALQHIGTRRISFLFAPVVLAWLFCNCTIGIYNLVAYNPGIVRAFSPYYMYKFFRESGRKGWISLGGVLLCITGSEAMYADLGHFSRSSIKVAFTFVVYPALLLGYMGQAAYLSKNLHDIDHGFFHSIPKPVFWPVFLIATLASIVGSQAVISATFSIIKQCQALGCFPWVKVVHTSNNIHGQIYIPEINWMMLALSLSVTVGFQDTVTIGNAYGIAVVVVMLVTTFLTALVIVVVWQRSIILACIFFLVFGCIESLYLSSALFKVQQGGWVPLVLAGITMTIMYVWHYGTTKKYKFDLQNKVSMKWLLTLGPGLGIARVPGIGLIYTELVTGVPAIFSHFVTNLPAFHQVLVFVCMKSVPVPFVPPHERYLVGRVGPREFRMYRCVVRYGYKDTIGNDENEFENQLIFNLAEFIQTEGSAPWIPSSSEMSLDGRMTVMGTLGGSFASNGSLNSLSDAFSERNARMRPTHSSNSLPSSEGVNSPRRRQVQFDIPLTSGMDPEMRKELTDIMDAKEAGIAYVLGHSYVKAKKTSPWLKKFAINYMYTFLQRNCREPAKALHIPHTSLIEVGMVYYV
jgi:KUP system potassium uptake protein